jgi:hypothetical protein
MRAAIEGALSLDAMADDFAVAVFASGGQRVDGAFEAIEIMRFPMDRNLNGLVVIVSANFTFVHKHPLTFQLCIAAR